MNRPAQCLRPALWETNFPWLAQLDEGRRGALWPVFGSRKALLCVLARLRRLS